MRLHAGAAGVMACLLVATGCSHGSPASGQTGVPSTSQAPGNATALAGGGGEQSSAPRSTIVTTPSAELSGSSEAKEVDGTCPYISNADFHEYEGDTVGRVVVLQTKPVGCRFYFAYDETQIIGEVLVQEFVDATTANNSVVLASRSHPEVQSQLALGDGAVAYRTELQGEATWQCVLLVGKRAYTVRTRQNNTSQDAFNLARVIAHNVR